MASVAKFTVDTIDLEEEIKRRHDHAEATRHLYFIAARRIQAWIRGILTRNHFRLLHESAVAVQRHWRGYRARIAVNRYLVQRVHQMWQDHYDEMATRIQAFWRGYWIRKTVLDVQKMRRWLNEVYLKNQETVSNMKKYKQEVIEYVHAAMECESMQWILFILFKLHHLLRTKQRSGVITRIDKTRFTFIEGMLKCLEYKWYVRQRKNRAKKKCGECDIDREATFLLRGTYYERCEKEIRQLERNLRAGVVPIYRTSQEVQNFYRHDVKSLKDSEGNGLVGEPYEEYEKMVRKLNQQRLEAFLHEPLEATKQGGTEKEECDASSKQFRQSCVRETDLCEKIARMDCHLKEVRLRCPIHDPPCLT